MTAPRPAERRYSTADIVVMCTCGVIGGSAVLSFVFGVFAVAIVMLTPANPMTGLGLISAVLVASSSAVVAAIVLPGAAPPGLRAKAYGLSSAIFGAVALSSCAAVKILW